MKGSIGENLKKCRVDAKKSVKEISDLLKSKGFKASEKTIYSWESGNSQPSPDAFLIMCKAYNISDILKTFGYVNSPAHKEDFISNDNRDFIKKYRELDTHGKDMVDTVLQKEYDRIIELRDFAPQSKYIGKDPDNIVTVDLTPLAAHTRTDVEQTPEGVQHDLDIMNDDSQWEQKGEIQMPELSRFEGMVIKMLFNDTVQHNKPHVHVTYGEYRASVGIDGELLAGSLPQKQFKMLVGWLALHEDEAYAAWNKAVRGEHFDKIKPLQ